MTCSHLAGASDELSSPRTAGTGVELLALAGRGLFGVSHRARTGGSHERGENFELGGLVSTGGEAPTPVAQVMDPFCR